jgi:hypothetical protein
MKITITIEVDERGAVTVTGGTPKLEVALPAPRQEDPSGPPPQRQRRRPRSPPPRP